MNEENTPIISESDESKEQLPDVRSSGNLNILFPAANEHIPPEEAAKNREVIQSSSAYTDSGEVFINAKALPQLLATDRAGANKFYNDLEKQEQLENGQERYASVPSVQKELSKRIQEPRDTIQKERLRDAENCVTAIRDAPELEKIREVEESKIRKEQRTLKGRKIESEGITECHVTGLPLEPNAEAHHIVRRADNPREARNLANVVIVNPDVHREIHKAGAETPEELTEFKKNYKHK
ncbi:hypothetical protein [Asaia spathodeae]|uniref:HNH homing endonuclease n=1 Tax=Asaia spathodeae TaxID=657016 RepID=A0ABX2P841_9PROT|nr:hypothetical protein [Asaia spathodeae]GBR19622.1 hypothetical protein AA105894_2357 [Asaia spathodeae NBRC 105894]